MSSASPAYQGSCNYIISVNPAGGGQSRALQLPGDLFAIPANYKTQEIAMPGAR